MAGMYLTYDEYTGYGVIGDLPASGEVVLRLHQRGGNAGDLDLLDAGDSPVDGAAALLHIKVPGDARRLLEHGLHLVGAVQDAAIGGDPGVVHVQHQLVKHGQHVLLGQRRGVSGHGLLGAVFGVRAGPELIERGDQVGVHLRELLLLVEHSGDVLDTGHLVGLVDVLGVDQGGPLALVGERLGLPGVVIVAGGGGDGVPVRRHAARGGDVGDIDGLAVLPHAVTPVVLGGVQRTEVQNVGV